MGTANRNATMVSSSIPIPHAMLFTLSRSCSAQGLLCLTNFSDSRVDDAEPSDEEDSTMSDADDGDVPVSSQDQD